MQSNGSSSSAWGEVELYGAESGWVEARKSCDHLSSLSPDLSHVPAPDSQCSRIDEIELLSSSVSKHYDTRVMHEIEQSMIKDVTKHFRCQHPAENWLCLSCKDVFCSRFINKHMVHHHQETGHCLALSFSDLSVWCFACDAYLDVQVIQQLQPVYEIVHLLKFGERPPFQTINGNEGSSSG